jgi:hypothetical protein
MPCQGNLDKYLRCAEFRVRAHRVSVDSDNSCVCRAIPRDGAGFPRVRFTVSRKGDVMDRTWVLRSKRENGVLTVGAMGVATPEGVRVLRAFVKAAIGEFADAAVLVDLRAVQFELTADDWVQVAKDSARAAFQPPVAMVVSPHHHDFAVKYCYTAAELGMRRMAFTETEPAYEWAQEHSLLGRRHAACTGRLPSRPLPRLRLV